jgi:ubiquinone/menaquinone biosynthesis C-methylase UbiE
MTEVRHPGAAGVDFELLQILRCPATQRRLTAEGNELVPEGVVDVKYAVEQGIPLLIDDENVVADQQRGIVRSFSKRAASYFSDNYLLQNSERAARYELVARITRSLIDEGMVVGDVGSGPAVFSEAISGLHARYVAIDLSLENLLAARERVPGVSAALGTVTALPLKDASLDLVLCIGCLEYVPEQQRATEELLRVTKPGGYIIASFANALSPRRWWDEGVVHRLRRTAIRSAGSSDFYVRQLTRPDRALKMIRGAGGSVCGVEYFGQGLAGYPLSELRSVRAGAAALIGGVTGVRKVAAEFLVVARREA